MTIAKPLATFVRADEGANTIDISFCTPEGGSGCLTLGARDATAEYRLTALGSGTNEQLGSLVYISLAKAGETGDARWHGSTHLLQLAATNEQAIRLVNQLSDFNKPAQDIAVELRVRTETVTGIAYAEDHIAVNYSAYQTLKLGLYTGVTRFTLKSCGRIYETHESTFPRLYFVFEDETGTEQFVPFNARDSKIDALHAELRTFVETQERVRFQDVSG